jgi:hypothetical protein
MTPRSPEPERLKIACTECVDGYRNADYEGEECYSCETCNGLGYTIETEEQALERTRDSRVERFRWERR